MEEHVGNLVLAVDEKVRESREYFHDEEEYLDLVDRVDTLRYDYFTLYNKDGEDYVNIVNAIQEINDIVDSHKELYYDRIHTAVDVGLLDVAGTSAVFAVRYKNSIVLSADTPDELQGAVEAYKKKYGVDGKEVDFSSKGSYKGIMYGQRQGKRMFDMGFAKKDISNKGLGLTKQQAANYIEKRTQMLKRKREEEPKKPRAKKLVKDIKKLEDVLRDFKPAKKKKKVNKVTPKVKPTVTSRPTILNKYGEDIFFPKLPKDVVEKNFYKYRGYSGTFEIVGDYLTDKYFRGPNVGLTIPFLTRNDGGNAYKEFHSLLIDLSSGRSKYSVQLRKELTIPVTKDLRIRKELAHFVDKTITGERTLAICNLTLRFGAGSQHANAVVFDYKRKTIVRFEPHGATTNAYSMIKVDKIFNDATKEVWKGWKYVPPQSYQKPNGPQGVEPQRTNWPKKVDKKGRRMEAGGFCKAFAAAFGMVYAIAGDDYDHTSVIKALQQSPNDTANYVRNIMAHVVIEARKKGYIK